MSWRSRAHQVISQVITDVGTEDPKALKKALCDAYPFGLRRWHPYKIWLDEIKRQLTPRPHTPPPLPEPDGPLLELMRKEAKP